MDKRKNRYEKIKKILINWLKKSKEELEKKGLEITIRKNNSSSYIVDFFNGYTFGGFTLLRDQGFRPFDFIEFEVIDIIDEKSVVPYYFYDEENTTIEEILEGVQKGVEFLINYYPK